VLWNILLGEFMKISSENKRDPVKQKKDKEKYDLEKKLNAIVRLRTCQKVFKNDAPPHNFFPTTNQYDDLIKEGKDKGVFVFYKGKGSLDIEFIVAYPLSIIKEILQLENKKVNDFGKYQKNCILPLISKHRLEASLKKKNQDRPFYIDLEKVQSITKYCFKNKDDLLNNYKRIF